MKREEQRAKAAYEYIQSDSVAAGDEALAFCDFINGAKWADQHPNWIPVDKELPKEAGSYLCCDDDDFVGELIWTGYCWKGDIKDSYNL